MDKKVVVGLLSLILYVVFFLPFLDWDIKVQAAVTLVIIQMLWIGRVFPLAFSSILLILILSFHFFSYEETLGYISTDIVWLLFSTFIISRAFISTGLASRVSLKMLKLSGGSGRLLILFSFILMFVLSMLIPSNVGKGSLVSSVLDRLMDSLKKIRGVENLGKSLFIGIAYLVAISGAVVATGASSTIYTFGLFSEISPDLNYVKWLGYFVPPILLFVMLLWLLFLYVFPPENIDRKHLMGLLDDKISELGKLSLPEKKVMGIMAMTILLWATHNWHGLSISLVGLLSAALTVLPGIGVWNWETAKKAIDWDMMLFFASTLMVSGMLIKTGAIKWISDYLLSVLASESSWLIVFVLVICTALLRIIFVNILGFLAIMIPLAITIGQDIPDFSPLVVAMAVFLTGVPGFMLITQSPVHLISHSYGYFSETDLLKVGIPSALLWFIVIMLSVMFYW
ncbi:SLC13 family permease [Bacillus sp. Marseille-Q3570]|uniref:SLC13 family permease n=1 Tax=Bacillus sp. Marseille-Q3570 TaxID=2963522 RepID=UPI0021B6F83B|nr:SLC13 family permease [Bacillus sp. Marseille-Q3570]